jgi:hypothetical protein
MERAWLARWVLEQSSPVATMARKQQAKIWLHAKEAAQFPNRGEIQTQPGAADPVDWSAPDDYYRSTVRKQVVTNLKAGVRTTRRQKQVQENG